MFTMSCPSPSTIQHLRVFFFFFRLYLTSCDESVTNYLKLVLTIGNCRNVTGLGKSMVVFGLFEKLRYSNERSTKFESFYQE